MQKYNKRNQISPLSTFRLFLTFRLLYSTALAPTLAKLVSYSKKSIFGLAQSVKWVSPNGGVTSKRKSVGENFSCQMKKKGGARGGGEGVC